MEWSNVVSSDRADCISCSSRLLVADVLTDFGRACRNMSVPLCWVAEHTEEAEDNIDHWGALRRVQSYSVWEDTLVDA